MTMETNNITGIDWPDGWYLYEDGAITGPHKTKDAFIRQTNNSSSEDLMISRKGFSQWYNYNDISQIYRQADKTFLTGNMSVREIEKTLSNDIERLSHLLKQVEKEAAIELKKNTTLQEISSLTEFKPKGLKELEYGISSIDSLSDKQGEPLQVTHPIKNQVIKKELGPKTTQTVSSENNVFFKNQIAEQERNIQSKKDPAPNKIQQAAAYTTIGMQNKAKPTAPQIKKQSTPFTGVPNYGPTTKESQLVYNHMMLAGRLRLGPLNDPLYESYVKFFATIGLYFGFWVRKSYDQVFFHLTGSAPKNNFQVLFALTPILHFFEVYQLAKMIKQMESQNGYTRTSPLLAMFLAIFPPFAMTYLQKALNGHWTLHVMNATRTNQNN